MPRGTRSGLIVVVIVFVTASLLAPAFSAAAGKPITLDSSPGAGKPTVVVDSKGTAHFAWNLNGAGTATDELRYCQIPRGKRSCKPIVAIRPPVAKTFAPPRILLPENGHVLLLTYRCCTTEEGSPVYLYDLGTDGKSYSPPVQIGDNEPTGDVRLGPGAFSVSSISSVTTGGVTFQTAPLDTPSPVTQKAVLGDAGPFAADYDGSIAFLDPLTPIVAMSDLDNVYFRRFGGGTAYNDAAAWGPITSLGAGDDPELAGLPSGKQGVHLLMRVGNPGKRRYVDRRFDGTTFGPPATVSETGDPIFRKFFMDPSGRLHAIWVNNALDSLRHRTEPAGKSWQPSETLLGTDKADDVYNTEGDAASDGGGWAVWDANNSGPIRAVAFGPTGPVGSGGGGGGEGPKCVPELRVGGGTVTAEEGCLAQDPKNKSRYTTTGDVRVNGIDLKLGGGGSKVRARRRGAPKLTVDTDTDTLVSGAKVQAKVGNVVLGSAEVKWRLPGGTGQITDLVGNPAKFDLGKAGVSFLGLDVSGYAIPSLDGKEKIEIPINLELPAPFDSVLGSAATGQVTLRASTDKGLELSGLKMHIEDVSLGIALVKTFNVNYIGDPFLLQGDTAILLPPAGSELGIDFGFRDGGFDYGHGAFTFPAGSLVVATDVLLRKIAFSVQAASTCDKPTKIGGGVTLATGPDVAGTGLISVDGNVAYSFPRSSCGTPGILDVDGAGALAGVPVANLHSRLTTDGNFTFDSEVKFDVSLAHAVIDVNGGVDIPSKTFYAEGKGTVTAFGYDLGGADAIVSSRGLATCGSVAPLLEMGFAYDWGESIGLDNFDAPPDCDVDISAYKPAAFARRTVGGARVGGGTFKLAGGLRSATVRLDGSGGAPGFSLTGPGGVAVTYPGASAGTVSGDGYVVVPVGTQTFVKFAKPAAGSYSVTGATSGPALTGLSVAIGLPEPKVTANVGGRGHSRTIAYKVRPLDGQTVMFVEQAKGVRDVIGNAKGKSGTLRFHPAVGSARKRTVFALVSQDGVPRARIRLAKFTAPSPLPGKVRGLRLRRTGKGLVVSWKRAPGASKVAVAFALADGRRQAKVTKGKRVVIGGVPGIDSGRIEVAGLRRDNVAGPSVRAKLKAKPKRRKHHRPRH